MVLTYLQKLITHWSVVEYERCLVSLGKQNCTNTQMLSGKGEPEKTRNNTKSSHLWKEWGFFTSGEKMLRGENGEKSYVGEDTYCENPLKAISELTEAFGQWTELALMKLIRCNITKMPENNPGVFTSRLHYNVFINEVLSMYLTLSKCFICKGIPIRPSIPSSVIYMCLFSSSSHFILLASQYITTMHEIIPMCKKRAHDLENDRDELGNRVALEQVMDLRNLNMVTNDMTAVFANQGNLYREESIFKQHWDIEHEDILKTLSLFSHPAFLSYTLKFCENYAEEHPGNNKEIYSRLNDSDSPEFIAYLDYLEKNVPSITLLYSAFRIRSAPSVTVAGSTISNTTSGVSSMKPSKRQSTSLRSTRKRRKYH